MHSASVVLYFVCGMVPACLARVGYDEFALMLVNVLLHFAFVEVHLEAGSTSREQRHTSCC